MELEHLQKRHGSLNNKLTTRHHEVNRNLEHYISMFMAMKTYATVHIYGIKRLGMIEHNIENKTC